MWSSEGVVLVQSWERNAIFCNSSANNWKYSGAYNSYNCVIILSYFSLFHLYLTVVLENSVPPGWHEMWHSGAHGLSLLEAANDLLCMVASTPGRHRDEREVERGWNGQYVDRTRRWQGGNAWSSCMEEGMRKFLLLTRYGCSNEWLVVACVLNCAWHRFSSSQSDIFIEVFVPCQ